MPQCLKVCFRTKKETESCRSWDPKFHSKFVALAAQEPRSLKPCLHHLLPQALLCFSKKDALVMPPQGVDHSHSPEGPRVLLLSNHSNESRSGRHLLDVCTLFQALAYHSQVLCHVLLFPAPRLFTAVSPVHHLRTLGVLEALHYSIRRAG